MKHWYRGLGAAAAALLLGASLAGCGTAIKPSAGPKPSSSAESTPPTAPASSLTTPSVSPSTYTPKSTTIPVDGPKFPQIIKMAMGHISGLVKSSAEAPTIVPWPASGSTVMYYRYQTQGSNGEMPGLIERYRATLLSPTPSDPVAHFTSAVFDSSGGAGQDVAAHASDLGLSYPSTQGARIAVGGGVTATAGTEGSMDVLGWREGSWLVVVGEHGAMPLSSAKLLAEYLREHYMPVPEPQGSAEGMIAVSVESDGPYTDVAWQEGRWVYSTGTYPAAANPITTGLTMALSMRQYQGQARK